MRTRQRARACASRPTPGVTASGLGRSKRARPRSCSPGERARLSAEVSLRQSETLYRTLFEQTPVGVLLFDTELRVVDCNELLAHIIGSPRETLIGLEIAKLRDLRPFDAFQAALDGDAGYYEGPYLTTSSDRETFLAIE